LSVSGSTVYAGGRFTNIGGQARSHIAALDISTAAATPWNPGADSDVLAVAAAGAVYIGGGFDTVNSQPRAGIAALEPTDDIFHGGFE
jgi:hypothetical protein